MAKIEFGAEFDYKFKLIQNSPRCTRECEALVSCLEGFKQPNGIEWAVRAVGSAGSYRCTIHAYPERHIVLGTLFYFADEKNDLVRIIDFKFPRLTSG